MCLCIYTYVIIQGSFASRFRYSSAASSLVFGVPLFSVRFLHLLLCRRALPSISLDSSRGLCLGSFPRVHRHPSVFGFSSTWSWACSPQEALLLLLLPCLLFVQSFKSGCTRSSPSPSPFHWHPLLFRFQPHVRQSQAPVYALHSLFSRFSSDDSYSTILFILFFGLCRNCSSEMYGKSNKMLIARRMRAMLK